MFQKRRGGEYFTCTFMSRYSKQNRSKDNLITEVHYFRHSLLFRKYSSACTRWRTRLLLHPQNNFSTEYVLSYTLISKDIICKYMYVYVRVYACACMYTHTHISFILGVSRTHGWRKFTQTIKYYYDFPDAAIESKSCLQVSLGLCSIMVHRRKEIITKAFYHPSITFYFTLRFKILMH